ncbi:hypothetical protein CDAR_454321 [Caerostris darwini]|uniref:Uncharacterized protein n=1 Tax=Caerostris darwini TaxID=1538125 RepID=A0AAV4V7D8_9ARAC|nr:hypothetical protein CDAR_454321 [Caerostris darwini]
MANKSDSWCWNIPREALDSTFLTTLPKHKSTFRLIDKSRTYSSQIEGLRSMSLAAMRELPITQVHLGLQKIAIMRMSLPREACKCVGEVILLSEGKMAGNNFSEEKRFLSGVAASGHEMMFSVDADCEFGHTTCSH